MDGLVSLWTDHLPYKDGDNLESFRLKQKFKFKFKYNYWD